MSSAPRFRFFGGKGGTGKTTCAAAAALAAAGRGRRVLVVSTDPAHSLGDALGRRLSARPCRLATRRGALGAVELDADRALERWIARRRRPLRTIAERGTYLDDDDVDRLLALSLPGVDELIGLVELRRLARQRPWDEVIVDTAPTGHTLRLLAMPDTLRRIAAVLSDMLAKHHFLSESLGGAHRADTADALVAELDAEGRALAALLRDPEAAVFDWITLPEPLALEETRDGVRALAAAGIAVRAIIVNRVTPPPAGPCALCLSRVREERRVIAALHAAFPGRTGPTIAAASGEPRGPAALRAIGAALDRPPLTPSRPPPRGRRRPAARPGPPPAWTEALAPPGLRVLAFAGKGGVGKTSCAAAVALGLAERAPARRVLLLSTDPAHSLADVLQVPVGDEVRGVPGAPPGLRVRELDAEAAFRARRERYRRAVDEVFDALLRRSRFDLAYDRDVVRQLIDLAPPGLDELFAILTVVEAVVPGDAPYDLVVLDTAPTGHALRLLAMPGAALEWVHALLGIFLKYRAVIGLGELAGDLLAMARDLRELGALLRDPARARAVAVARPAALPRLETVRLIRGLKALALPLAAVLVNALTPPGCAACRRAAARERREVAALRAACRSAAAGGCAIIAAPAQSPPPGGVEDLKQWVRRWEWQT